MLNRTFLLTLVMAVAMLLFPGQVLAAEPIGGFWGTVAAGGDSVPDGSVVTAWIDGVKVAETQTVNSTYDFFIKGDYTEKTVVFKVGKHTAEQTAIWEQGTTQLIDLSVNAWSMQCEFYGTVNINGTHVPDGTEVSAWIDMARVQSTFTIDSMYHLIVPGNYEGQSVYFKIGSYLANPIVDWQRGEDLQINLSVSLGPPVCAFYGPVKIGGADAPNGTAITAWIDNVKLQETTTASGVFGLNIPGDYDGAAVSFKIDDETAPESAVWVRGSNVQISLTGVVTDDPEVRIVLSANEVRPGEEFTLSVIVNPNGHGISAGEVDLFSIDTEIMEIMLDKVTSGTLVGSDPTEGTRELISGEDAESLAYALARKGETPVPGVEATLAVIGLRIKGGAPKGNYAIPNAIILTDEHFSNLNFTPPTVAIKVIEVIPGDINFDDVVGLADLALLASAFGMASGETTFRAGADLNSSGEIDIEDLAILAGNWGQRRFV